MNVEELLKRYEAGERDFSGTNLSEVSLSQVNLSGADLSHANLSLSNLSGSNLSGANLSGAKLNVARMSGANLSRANLTGAILNVANLVRADLRGATLKQADLIRAELVRADLTGADLWWADLSTADLRETQLRQANFTEAKLKETDVRGASLILANLIRSNIQGANFSQSILAGADLREVEARHANFSQADLSGANLSSANLRWVNFQKANLSWSDCSGARLSGAKLIEANLTNANLMGASLVHADMTGAHLAMADWADADLSHAILTGAKLHATSRFGLKTDGLVCDWVDLSPQGDRTQIYHLRPDEAQRFFNRALPKVEVIVDTRMNPAANYALAKLYHRLSLNFQDLSQPPSLTLNRRRTALSFQVERDEQLFALAYLASVPFRDAVATQSNLMDLLQQIQAQGIDKLNVRSMTRVQHIFTALKQTAAELSSIRLPSNARQGIFFQAPTQTILTNSNQQTLILYYHPLFGKRLIRPPDAAEIGIGSRTQLPQAFIPSIEELLDFIKGFYYLN